MGKLPNDLGKFIRQQRLDKNMTLRKLEEITGVSYSQLSKIERGENIPLKANLEKIAEALGGDKDIYYQLAGYTPVVLPPGYQMQLPGLSQEEIYDEIATKLKEAREKEGKETPSVSFDKDGFVYVFETETRGESVYEKVERYRAVDVLFGEPESQLVSVRNTPKNILEVSLFSDWLKDMLIDLSPEEQEAITEELKEFTEFKLFQLNKKK